MSIISKKKNLYIARDSKINDHPYHFFKLIVFLINEVSLTSDDRYRWDFFSSALSPKSTLPHPSIAVPLMFTLIGKVFFFRVAPGNVLQPEI